ncbi:MAG TPA: VTT domain-containing protein [Pyrinomonadaceae bacterium]|nr:VTT domain-containing protein [Pyrinomonadaceae bacterium]
MKRYLLIVAAIMTFFLLLFFAVEALGFQMLKDPTPWMRHGGVLAAALGVSLLVADVLLPVPSSLVMIAHGALFGVAIGTLLSLLGSVGAALFGFMIGRRGGKLLERIVTPKERARADKMLARWGVLAVVITRPVPILAETVAIMTGASSLGWLSMVLASFAGALPPALLYALTGAWAAS